MRDLIIAMLQGGIKEFLPHGNTLIDKFFDPNDKTNLNDQLRNKSEEIEKYCVIRAAQNILALAQQLDGKMRPKACDLKFARDAITALGNCIQCGVSTLEHDEAL